MISIRFFNEELIQINTQAEQLDYAVLDLWRKAKDLESTMTIRTFHKEYIPVSSVPECLEHLYAFTSNSDTKANLEIPCVQVEFLNDDGTVEEETIILHELTEEQAVALRGVIDYA